MTKYYPEMKTGQEKDRRYEKDKDRTLNQQPDKNKDKGGAQSTPGQNIGKKPEPSKKL